MSTPNTPVVAPVGKLTTIVAIINAALQGLTLIPGLGTGVAGAIQLEQLLQGVLMNALAAYRNESGAPIDLSKIPLETPVP